MQGSVLRQNRVSKSQYSGRVQRNQEYEQEMLAKEVAACYCTPLTSSVTNSPKGGEGGENSAGFQKNGKHGLVVWGLS